MGDVIVVQFFNFFWQNGVVFIVEEFDVAGVLFFE